MAPRTAKGHQRRIEKLKLKYKRAEKGRRLQSWKQLRDAATEELQFFIRQQKKAAH
jgi:hypothetical protein